MHAKDVVRMSSSMHAVELVNFGFDGNEICGFRRLAQAFMPIGTAFRGLLVRTFASRPLWVCIAGLFVSLIQGCRNRRQHLAHLKTSGNPAIGASTQSRQLSHCPAIPSIFSGPPCSLFPDHQLRPPATNGNRSPFASFELGIVATSTLAFTFASPFETENPVRGSILGSGSECFCVQYHAIRFPRHSQLISSRILVFSAGPTSSGIFHQQQSSQGQWVRKAGQTAYNTQSTKSQHRRNVCRRCFNPCVRISPPLNCFSSFRHARVQNAVSVWLVGSIFSSAVSLTGGRMYRKADHKDRFVGLDRRSYEAVAWGILEVGPRRQ